MQRLFNHATTHFPVVTESESHDDTPSRGEECFTTLTPQAGQKSSSAEISCPQRGEIGSLSAASRASLESANFVFGSIGALHFIFAFPFLKSSTLPTLSRERKGGARACSVGATGMPRGITRGTPQADADLETTRAQAPIGRSGRLCTAVLSCVSPFERLPVFRQKTEVFYHIPLEHTSRHV